MMITIGAIGVVAIIIIWAVILRGWVLSIIWGWFAVPIFGLPPLGIAEAIAVALVLAMLTHQHHPGKGDLSEQASYAFLGPPLVLCVGWIVKGFI